MGSYDSLLGIVENATAYLKYLQRRNLVFFLQKRGCIIVFHYRSLRTVTHREQHAATDPTPNERLLFRKISIFQARAQDGGIRLNQLTQVHPEVPQENMRARDVTGNQPGDLKADIETRDTTEAQDDAQFVTGRHTQNDEDVAASNTPGKGHSGPPYLFLLMPLLLSRKSEAVLIKNGCR